MQRYILITLFLLMSLTGCTKSVEEEKIVISYDNKYLLLEDYSNRVQLEAEYIQTLQSFKGDMTKSLLFTQGYVLRNDTLYYGKLESSITGLYKDSADNISNIIKANQMVNESIHSTFDFLRRNESVQKQAMWNDILVEWKLLYPLLVSGSTNELSLYNITAKPDEFLQQDLSNTLDPIISISERIAQLSNQP